MLQACECSEKILFIKLSNFMKYFINKLSPEWILRISLATMYFYSGLDLIRHPKAWYWAVRPLPQFVHGVVNAFGIDLFLQVQGLIELAFAVVLVLWFLPKIWAITVSFLTALEMAAILFFVGVDGVTFRDIGLLGGAVALFFL